MSEPKNKHNIEDIQSQLDERATKTELEAVASGGPKATFDTLTDLQNDANANTVDGKKSIYLVLADGKWYYWNGSVWTAGGIYQATSIPDGSLGRSKLSDYFLNVQTTDLAEGTDLNSLKKHGTYLGLSGRSYLNMPSAFPNGTFYLNVFSAGASGNALTYFVQILYSWSDPSIVYFRKIDTSNSANNTAWKPITIADNSITTAKMANKGMLEINRDANYPFKSMVRDGLDKGFATIMQTAILDVKVYGARKGKYYRFEWIGHGTTAFGDTNYEILCNEYEATNYSTSSTTGMREIIKLGDIPATSIESTSGVITRLLIPTRASDILIEITYDTSKLTVGNQYIINSSSYNGYSAIIHPSCYIYADNNITAKKDMFVKFEGTKFRTAFKYDNSNDLWVDFDKCGASNLPQFKTLIKAPNTSKDLRTDLSTILATFYSGTTDWIGPYTVKALNNADGDNQVSGFTGGWHGYNGDQTGSATARNTRYEVFADNFPITDGMQTYANRVDIYVTNRIQGWNTKKSDGSGREILEEKIHYIITKNKIDVEVEFSALEDIEISTYYGIQVHLSTSWNNMMFFHDGAGTLVDGATTYNIGKNYIPYALYPTAGTKVQGSECNRFKANNASGDVVEAYVNENLGLGKRKFILDTTALAWKSGSKIYMNLVKDTIMQLMSGEVAYYSGGYKFYKS